MASATQPPLQFATPLPTQYAPELCGYCGGSGFKETGICAACNGQRVVLVHQPSLACPRCMGTGRATDRERAYYYSRLCIICHGTGWVMTFGQVE